MNVKGARFDGRRILNGQHLRLAIEGHHLALEGVKGQRGGEGEELIMLLIDSGFLSKASEICNFSLTCNL